jgi:sulfate permease, SulP family
MRMVDRLPFSLDRIAPYLPKSLVCVREGYGRAFFLNDLVAGITVGIIALPLAMAFAIHSGVSPERGLYTAVIAGFIVSALGGSRVAVAGPTGAFIPILYAIVDQHGYDGLVLATLMAGAILILLGVSGLGTMIKFIPYPVTTGFTAGIAVIIFSQQMKDLFGLTGHAVERVPVEFMEKWTAYAEALTMHGINPYTTALGVGGVLSMVLVRRWAPRVPGAIVVLILSAVLVAAFGLDAPDKGVETIGSRFATPEYASGIPDTVPTFRRPVLGEQLFSRVRELLPSALTIALLAAIESLLCCVVADGMIGGRHRSNVELVAQGLANIGSALFGGIPATGAIARTSANIKSGGKTPLAGMIHAVTVLVCMLLLAPYASRIPLAALAAVLVIVAANMSEYDHFRHLLRAPKSDILVLLMTFALTVLTDLTLAVGVGMVMAAMMFMRRMTEVTAVRAVREEIREEGEEFRELTDPDSIARRRVPKGVEVFEINGPFFFGVADRLKDTLRTLERPPVVFILRLRRVPTIDATGMHALEEFYFKCQRQGTQLVLSGVQTPIARALIRYGLYRKLGKANVRKHIDEALLRANEILAERPT